MLVHLIIWAFYVSIGCILLALLLIPIVIFMGGVAMLLRGIVWLLKPAPPQTNADLTEYILQRIEERN